MLIGSALLFSPPRRGPDTLRRAATCALFLHANPLVADFVRKGGFEPPVSTSQTWRDTWLRYFLMCGSLPACHPPLITGGFHHLGPRTGHRPSCRWQDSNLRIFQLLRHQFHWLPNLSVTPAVKKGEGRISYLHAVVFATMPYPKLNRLGWGHDPRCTHMRDARHLASIPLTGTFRHLSYIFPAILHGAGGRNTSQIGSISGVFSKNVLLLPRGGRRAIPITRRCLTHVLCLANLPVCIAGPLLAIEEAVFP